MVKKLLKHEFAYYLRTFGVFWPIVLVIAAVTRFFRFINDGRVITEIATGSSIFMLVVACIALILLSTVISVVRFYKNMYSSEGYLTFTLPVTNTQHIFVKLLASIGCQIICALTVLVAIFIAISGEIFAEFVDILSFAIEDLVAEIGMANCLFFAIELILLLILSTASGMLLYYGCITVGQTAKKNRILMAVAVYFAYYMVSQIISTIFSIIFILLGSAGAFDSIVAWFESHYIAGMHIMFCGGVLLYGALAAIFWLVTQTIMTKKLNLE